MKITPKEQQVIDKFEKWIYENNPSNEFYVQIIERAGSYLNLQAITDYVKENKISCNVAKKYRNVLDIFNIKFVIENE